ncbi:MAG TPA: sigma-70 family RNA polymerase sigma factor [Bryobacteraceae bacterium]|nr:sigma-70 family RNA polymerase sigma factor [Bryobacteraceae bacterium]
MSRTPNAPESETTNESCLLRIARGGDESAFHRLIEPHRRELQLHSYRMLGSFQDAEDMVQETLLRAWRGLQGFEGRASIRQWLYRIATNACLSALATRGRNGRVLPETHRSPTTQMPDREPANDIPWLEPYPDSALEGIAESSPGPDARYEMREAVQLAFMAAIQLLPPRQRAVLLLQDVMGWSAIETARLLNCSPAAVNSALQRARATLEERLPTRESGVAASMRVDQRALLGRYVRAWETTDIDGFSALLREDAVMSMPPWRQWYRGRSPIVTFFAATGRPGGHAPFRLVPTAANSQTAFAFYSRWQSPDWRFHSIQVLQFDSDAIARLTSFVMPALASIFGLPAVLPPDGDIQ